MFLIKRDTMTHRRSTSSQRACFIGLRQREWAYRIWALEELHVVANFRPLSSGDHYTFKLRFKPLSLLKASFFFCSSSSSSSSFFYLYSPLPFSPSLLSMTVVKNICCIGAGYVGKFALLEETPRS
jgi:hypothetical protein